LYETSGRIDFIYGTVDGGGASATVGLQMGTGTTFTQFECNSGGLSPGFGITYTPTTCGTPSATPTSTATSAATATSTATATGSPACTPSAWQAGPAQPPARYAIQGAVGTDNKLYVAGGQSIDNPPIVYNQFSRFDPATNTWSNLAPLPVALGQGTVGAANGKVFLAGGFTGGTSVTNALQIYDIASNTWSSGAAMPNAGIEAAAGAVVNGKFYVMGGDDFNNLVNTTYIYDIATNTWTTGAALPDSRTNTYGTAVNGLIYVYGGVIALSPAFVTTDTLLRYDPVANSWSNLGSTGSGLGNYGADSPFGTGQLLIADGADGGGISSVTTHFFTQRRYIQCRPVDDDGSGRPCTDHPA
jgi:hypothetical protein